MYFDARRWTATHSEAEAARPGMVIVRGELFSRRGPESVASREWSGEMFMSPVWEGRDSHGLGSEVMVGVEIEIEVEVGCM